MIIGMTTLLSLLWWPMWGSMFTRGNAAFEEEEYYTRDCEHILSSFSILFSSSAVGLAPWAARFAWHPGVGGAAPLVAPLA